MIPVRPAGSRERRQEGLRFFRCCVDISVLYQCSSKYPLIPLIDLPKPFRRPSQINVHYILKAKNCERNHEPLPSFLPPLLGHARVHQLRSRPAASDTPLRAWQHPACGISAMSGEPRVCAGHCGKPHAHGRHVHLYHDAYTIRAPPPSLLVGRLGCDRRKCQPPDGLRPLRLQSVPVFLLITVHAPSTRQAQEHVISRKNGMLTKADNATDRRLPCFASFERVAWRFVGGADADLASNRRKSPACAQPPPFFPHAAKSITLNLGVWSSHLDIRQEDVDPCTRACFGWMGAAVTTRPATSVAELWCWCTPQNRPARAFCVGFSYKWRGA